MSSTISVTVCGPPELNVWRRSSPSSSAVPSSSRSQLWTSIRFSGSLASEVERDRLPHLRRRRRVVELGARVTVLDRHVLVVVAVRPSSSVTVSLTVRRREPVGVLDVRAARGPTIVELPFLADEGAVVGRGRGERDVSPDSAEPGSSVNEAEGPLTRPPRQGFLRTPTAIAARRMQGRSAARSAGRRRLPSKLPS